MVRGFLSLCVAGGLVTVFGARGALAADSARATIRCLVVTGGHGYEREPFQALFKGHGDIEARHVQHPNAIREFAPEAARSYDVLVLYDLWQKITPKGQKDLLTLLKNGKGLVVLHHALANYQDWPEFARIAGGKFYLKETDVGGRKHPPSGWKHGVDLKVSIADRVHPITRGMKDFAIHDETYKSYDVDPNANVLLTTDEPTSEKVIGWSKTYAKARVVTLQGGHDHLAYENPNFRTLIARAIRWAAGRLPSDAETDLQQGFVSLFNGKDLAPWVIMGDPKGWKVLPNGVLRSDGGMGGNWLRSKKVYSDFIYKVEWRVSKKGNSGVFIRAREEGAPWVTGHEIQISNEPRDDAHCTGSLYGSVAVNPRPDESADVWHSFEVRCQGKHIVVMADGQKVIDADSDKVPALGQRPLEGYIGLQDSHTGKGGYIEYRNIRIRELRSGR